MPESPRFGVGHGVRWGLSRVGVWFRSWGRKRLGLERVGHRVGVGVGESWG